MPPSPKKILIAGCPKEHESIYKNALCDFHLSMVTKNTLLKQLKNEWVQAILIYEQADEGASTNLIQEIHQLINEDIPIIFILPDGHEKVAVTAKKKGIHDCLFYRELVPAIIETSVNHAIERKKWENIYRCHQSQTKQPFLQDDQSGLYTKSYFETRLIEEMKRSKRYHFPVTMLYGTLDRWKVYVREYGPSSMNEVLRKMGQLFCQNMRSSDLLARMKENQIAILLPHTHMEATKEILERLQTLLETHPFTVGNHNIYLTLQAIMIPLEQEMESMDDLLTRLEQKIHEEISILQTS